MADAKVQQQPVKIERRIGSTIIYTQVDRGTICQSQFICLPQRFCLLLLGHLLLIPFASGQKMSVTGPKSLV